MASNKRKGVDVSDENANVGPAFVVVESNDGDPDNLRKRLLEMREQQNGDDPVLQAMQKVGVNDGEAEATLLKESSSIKSSLQEKIQEAKDAYQKESSVLRDLKNQIDRLQEKRESLSNGINDLEQKQADLQKKIALHQEEAAQEIESIDQVEEDRKRQVPRLKTQISLYASTTGIKWDFADDEVLSGSVAIPDQQGLKSFSLDPREYSPIETANRLWSMMDGGN